MSTRHMKKIYGSDVILEKDYDASDAEISVTNDIKSKSFNVFDVVCIIYMSFFLLANAFPDPNVPPVTLLLIFTQFLFFE